MGKGKRLEIKEGERYGKLTVIKEVEPYISPKGKKTRRFLCKCDCKKEKEIKLNDLRSGKTKSCGCMQREVASKVNKVIKRKYNTYDLSGEYGVGYTTNTNDPFYFDLEDYNKIKDYCWQTDDRGYIRAHDTEKKKSVKMHRLITNCPDNMVIDHIDRNKVNNRKNNLRVCTQEYNSKNKTKQCNNTSGCSGVYLEKRTGKWFAVININKKSKYLGSFNTKEEAIEVRKAAEAKYYGEFAPQDESVLDQSK